MQFYKERSYKVQNSDIQKQTNKTNLIFFFQKSTLIKPSKNYLSFT